MKSSMHVWMKIVGIVGCFGIVNVLSPVHAEEWHVAYEAAVQAMQEENWPAAIELLHKAIQEDSHSSKHKKKYGVQFIEYYPYLKLGQAYLATKDAENARKYCEQAQQEGNSPAKEVANCLAQSEQTKGLDINPGREVISPVPRPDLPLSINDIDTLPPGGVYAVIIGIGDYQDEQIPDLRFTVNDAQGLYDVLTDPNYGDVSKDHVKLLVNQDATSQNIKREIGKWLSSQAQPQDTVIIYYSGHGAPESGETYWVTYDARIDDLYSTALSNNAIADMLARIKSERLITFLDSCYSAATVNRGDRTKSIYTQIPLEKFSGTGRAIISASDGKQLSLEMEQYQHGVFTYYLLESLHGKADQNHDGVVDVDEVWNYVKYQVTETAQKAGNSQTPVFQGQVTAGIPLTLNKTALKSSQEKLAELFKQKIIQKEQYDCALEILNSGKSDQLLNGLLSGKIADDLFGQLFKCEQ